MRAQFVVLDAVRDHVPPFSGPLSARACVPVRRAVPRSIRKEGVSIHYSGRFCMEKMELIHLLPPALDAIVLLDADVFCVNGCAAKFRDQFSRLGPEQFVLAPRADPRMILGGGSSPQEVGVPPRSEGINSGVLLINVTRMRVFEKSFCPNASWWRCILKQAPMGYNSAGGDQVSTSVRACVRVQRNR